MFPALLRKHNAPIYHFIQTDLFIKLKLVFQIDMKLEQQESFSEIYTSP